MMLITAITLILKIAGHDGLTEQQKNEIIEKAVTKVAAQATATPQPALNREQRRRAGRPPRTPHK
jgi:hypothetical protein